MVMIHEIDFENGLVITTDDRRLAIADLFDRHGVPTIDPRQAIMGFAGEPGGWISFKLQDFDKSRLQ
jgi:hypothetical protein